MSYEPPARHGRLRIYLGRAPGVGKTYAMLGEARRRAERDTDVVVGVVEAHGRPKTQALLEGLEVVARRRISYRGAGFTSQGSRTVMRLQAGCPYRAVSSARSLFGEPATVCDHQPVHRRLVLGCPFVRAEITVSTPRWLRPPILAAKRRPPRSWCSLLQQRSARRGRRLVRRRAFRSLLHLDQVVDRHEVGACFD